MGVVVMVVVLGVTSTARVARVHDVAHERKVVPDVVGCSKVNKSFLRRRTDKTIRIAAHRRHLLG